MRYGILSDVHGNLEALQVACAHLAGQNIDGYAFLGDAVGYGADPDEVCTILRQRCATAVLGNHDAAVTGRMDIDGYFAAAKDSLRYSQRQLSPQNLAWLATLPYTALASGVLFCHGSPRQPELFEYLTRQDQVEELIQQGVSLAQVTCIGHSHLTTSFEVNNRQVLRLPPGDIVCDPAKKYIITVGSVGQPRDRDPRSCCAVFDTVSRRFEYHRLHYDVQATRQKILDAGLLALFGDRLTVGM